MVIIDTGNQFISASTIEQIRGILRTKNIIFTFKESFMIVPNGNKTEGNIAGTFVKLLFLFWL